MSTDAYAVEGYGERTPEYDGPYLDGHRLDPNVAFAFAGDPEKAAQLQDILADTDGTPVFGNGVITVKTAEGEPNVVIYAQEPEDVKTIVLDRSKVDEINDERKAAELAGPPTVDEDGEVVDPEVPDFNGPSGKDETRDGESYNTTVDNNDNEDKGFSLS